MASGVCVFPRGGGRRNPFGWPANWLANGAQSFCQILAPLRDLRADLSRRASLADDERFRATGLDGLRLVHRRAR